MVIHSGTANGGHYFSYINERGTDTWCEFNDWCVSPWDVSKMEEDCFGGEEEVQYAYNNQKKKRINCQNALVVIYERVKTELSQEVHIDRYIKWVMH